VNIVSGALQAVSRTADAATAAAGAVGGAAVNGAVGGIKGVGAGIRSGVSQGSRSPAAAALTLAAVGAAGLVEWPVLLTVGGAALVVHQINQRTADGRADDEAESARDQSPPKRSTATKRAAPAKRSSTAKTASRPKATTRRSTSRRTSAATRSK
jgi:hypothetical protein